LLQTHSKFQMEVGSRYSLLFAFSSLCWFGTLVNDDFISLWNKYKEMYR
jgi:hypothetical protein